MAKLDLALVVRAVDRATQPLRRVQRTLRRVGEAASRVGRRAAEMGRRAGIALALAGGAAAGFAIKLARSGDRVAKMADRVGLGIEELQKLQFAFDIGGVSAEQSGRAIEYFARSIGEAHKGTGEAAEILRAMNIELKNTDGSLKTTRQLLDEVADGFANQDNEAKKAFAAQRLFGRSGMPLVNALSGGAAELAKLGEEAARYGLISESGGRQSEAFVDEMTRLRAAFAGIGNALAETLLPALIPAMEALRDFLTDNRPEIVERIVSGMKKLADNADLVTAAVSALLVLMGAKFLFVFANPLGAVALAAAGLYLIWENWEEVVDWMETRLTHLVEVFRQAFEKIKSFFDFGGFLSDESGFTPRGIAGRGGGGPTLVLPPMRNEATRIAPLVGPEPADTVEPRGPRGQASISVDFSNMPRGTRVNTRADDDVDLEVTTGFAMQGAQ